MKSFAAALFAGLLVFAAACGGRGETQSDQHPPARTLVGQVLLPDGTGSRGVEVQVTVTGREPSKLWVLFDEQGRFTHTFHGSVVSLTVTAGIGAEVHRIDAEELPEVDRAGRIDVGVIDLVDRLLRYRLVLRAADGTPPGEVRAAVCLGLPPVGPAGARVALGSRQFPPIVLGSEVEWLLPRGAQSIYFLVERPDGPGRGREWRSGHQRLFGPFTSAELPAELVMD